MAELLHTALIAHDAGFVATVEPQAHALKPFGILPWSWLDSEWFGVLTEAELKTALGILKQVNHRGMSYPSVATIARNVALHEVTVSKSIRSLERYGLIECIRRRGRVTEYRVLQPKYRPAFTRESRKQSHDLNRTPLADGQGVVRELGVVQRLPTALSTDSNTPSPATSRSKDEHVHKQHNEHGATAFSDSVPADQSQQRQQAVLTAKLRERSERDRVTKAGAAQLKAALNAARAKDTRGKHHDTAGAGDPWR